MPMWFGSVTAGHCIYRKWRRQTLKVEECLTTQPNANPLKNPYSNPRTIDHLHVR